MKVWTGKARTPAAGPAPASHLTSERIDFLNKATTLAVGKISPASAEIRVSPRFRGRGINQAVTTKPAPPSAKPSAPSSLSVNSTPGELGMSATWGAASGATSYLLQWRRYQESFQSGNQKTTTGASATFSVPAQGDWVVRVEGCNESGCGRGASRRLRPGRSVLRTYRWFPLRSDRWR